nr:FixH family protein [Bacteriovorax sp. HI3]
MKKLAVVCLFLFIALGLFFLKENFNLKSRGEAKKADVVLTWDYNPKSIDLQTPVNFTFTLKDKEGKNIENAKIDIEATMNHGGMIPIFTEATYLKDAIYSTRFKLTMLGEWIIFLTITLPDGSVASKEVVLQTN